MASASDPIQGELEFYLQNLNNLKPSLFCQQDNETKLTFKNCSSEKDEKLELAVKYLLPKIKVQILNLEEYEEKKLTSSEMIFYNQVRKTFECVQKQIEKKLKFECVESYLCEAPYNYYMYTTPTLDQVFKDKTIRACPKATDDSPEFLAGVIVHEVSHLCGTEDFEYLKEKIPKTDYVIEGSNENGSLNADSYRYWFEHGFCIPDRDC